LKKYDGYRFHPGFRGKTDFKVTLGAKLPFSALPLKSILTPYSGF